MGEAQPTPADFRAADEVLAKFPEAFEQSDIAIARAELAATRVRHGDSLFRLYYQMREPQTRFDHLALKCNAPNATEKKRRRLQEAELQREIDLVMIDEVFNAYFEWLAAFAKLRNSLRRQLRFPDGATNTTDADRFEQDLRALNAPLAVYGPHVAKVVELAKVARIENMLGIAVAGRLQIASVLELLVMVRDFLRDAWPAFQAKFPSHPAAKGLPDEAVERRLFGEHLLGDYPKPLKLSALLDQEWAATKGWLISKAGENVIQVTLTAQTCTLHTEGLVSSANGGREKCMPLLTVDAWADLRLGIDEHRRVYATLEPLQHGDRFRKKRAVRLPLRGRRWETLLELLATSDDGQSTSSLEWLTRLGGAPPPSSLPDGQTSDLRAAYLQEAPLQKNATAKRVNDELKDLRKKLGRRITGPKGHGKSSVFMKGKRIESRFTIRHLITVGDGRYTWGCKPH